MDIFAVDFGTITTKVARLSPTKGNNFKLEALGIAQTPLGGIVNGNQSTLERTAEMLVKLRNDARINTKNVVVGIPESEVFTKLVSFPKMSIDDLSSAIAYEAEQYIPLPMQDVNYSYSLGADRPDGGMDVLIVAAPIKLIEKYEQVIQMAGLNPVAIDTDMISLSRCVIAPSEQDSILVVNIGARTTDLAIVRQGRVNFTRSIGVGSAALTRSLMNGLQIDEGQAEQFKRAYGLQESQLEGKVALALKQIAQTIAVEISRAASFYTSRSNQTMSSVKISGGGASLPGLVTYLSEFISGEIQLANTGLRIEQDSRLEKLENLSQYGIVLGLAMKEI